MLLVGVVYIINESYNVGVLFFCLECVFFVFELFFFGLYIGICIYEIGVLFDLLEEGEFVFF